MNRVHLEYKDPTGHQAQQDGKGDVDYDDPATQQYYYELYADYPELYYQTLDSNPTDPRLLAADAYARATNEPLLKNAVTARRAARRAVVACDWLSERPDPTFVKEGTDLWRAARDEASDICSEAGLNVEKEEWESKGPLLAPLEGSLTTAVCDIGIEGPVAMTLAVEAGGYALAYLSSTVGKVVLSGALVLAEMGVYGYDWITR